MQRIFSSTVHLHDKTFRRALAFPFPSFCQSLLNMILPEQFKKSLNLRAITPLKESFVGEELRKTISDCVFSIPYKKHQGIFVVIVEHQSSYDAKMILRMEEYKFSIFRSTYGILKSNASPLIPYIYAVELYHGQKKYGSTRRLEHLFHNPMNWSKPYDHCTHALFSVHEISDCDFVQYDWAGALCFAFKHVRGIKAINFSPGLLVLVDNLTGEDSEKFAVFVLEYFCRGANISHTDFDDVFSAYNQSTPTGRKIMTLVQHWHEQGMHKIIDLIRERAGQDPHLLELADALSEEVNVDIT